MKKDIIRQLQEFQEHFAGKAISYEEKWNDEKVNEMFDKHDTLQDMIDTIREL